MSRKSLKLTCNGGDNDSDEEDSWEIDYGLSLKKLFRLGPKKKLVVLSLNGVLLSRIHIADRCEVPKSRKPDGLFGHRLGTYTCLISYILSFFAFARILCCVIWSYYLHLNGQFIRDPIVIGLWNSVSKDLKWEYGLLQWSKNN